MRPISFILVMLLLTTSTAVLGLESKSPKKQKSENEVDQISDEEAEAFFQQTEAEGLTDSELDVFDIHERNVDIQPQPNPEAELPVLKKKRWRGLIVTGAVVTGLGAATLLGSVVTGTMAMSKDKEIKSNCPNNECEPDYHDILKKRNQLALTTDVLIGVGSAFTAAGIVVIIAAKVRQKKSHELVLSPFWGSSFAGVTAKWRF